MVRIRVDYTPETRGEIIAEQQAQGLRLTEDVIRGNERWMVFTDEPPQPPPPPKPTLAERITELEEALAILHLEVSQK